MKIAFGTRLGTAAVILLLSASAAAESWELRPAAAASPGSPEIEAGQPDDAIRVLVPALETASGVARLAVLENLCVAYALKQEYTTAMRFCDLAAAHGAAGAATFNNRGVVRAVTGDYRGAVRDFRRASCLPGCGTECDAVRAMVRRNLDRLHLRETISSLYPVFFQRGV